MKRTERAHVPEMDRPDGSPVGRQALSGFRRSSSRDDRGHIKKDNYSTSCPMISRFSGRRSRAIRGGSSAAGEFLRHQFADPNEKRPIARTTTRRPRSGRSIGMQLEEPVHCCATTTPTRGRRTERSTSILMPAAQRNRAGFANTLSGSLNTTLSPTTLNEFRSSSRGKTVRALPMVRTIRRPAVRCRTPEYDFAAAPLWAAFFLRSRIKIRGSRLTTTFRSSGARTTSRRA